MVRPLSENTLVISYKIEHTFIIKPAIPWLYFPKEMKTRSYIDFSYSNADSNFIQNSTNLKTTQMVINWWIDKLSYIIKWNTTQQQKVTS